MSLENKGSMATTIMVSREPDRSGNFICNGTNDHVEINQAIDHASNLGGGTVHVKIGVYNVPAESHIVIQPNVILEGEGPATIFTMGADCETYRGMIENEHYGSATIDDKFVLRNFAIDGNYDNQSNPNPCGILIGGIKEVVVEDLWTYDIYGHHIYIRWDIDSGRSKDITIRNIHGIKSAWNVIQAELVDNCIIHNVYAENTDTGIAMWGAINSIISNCRCYDNNNTDRFTNSIGIAVEGASEQEGLNNTIIGNVCDAQEGGIYVQWNLYCTVIGNVLINNTAVGVGFGASATDNVVIGNTFDMATASYGIDGVLTRNLIQGNVFTGGPSGTCAGIYSDLSNLSDVLIYDNFFVDIGAAAGWAIRISLGTGHSDFTIKDNHIIDTDGNHFAEAIRLDYVTGGLIEGNTFKGTPLTTLLQANCSNFKVLRNQWDGVTTLLTDLATNTTFTAYVFPFLEPIGAAAWDVTPPSGIDVDANTEGAFTMGVLPDDVFEVRRIKVWAVGLAAPGAGNEMEVEFNMDAGQPDEAYNAEAIAVVNKISDQTNFAVNDIVTWTLTSSDDSDIGDLIARDCFEIRVMHETSAGPDISTDALFRCVEIQYI